MRLHIKLAEARMTQKELCERTGIRPPTISAYCNDTFKHLVKDHLNIFCEVFDCTISDLVVYEKE